MCVIPHSLSLFDSVTGLGLDYLNHVCVYGVCVCMHIHVEVNVWGYPTTAECAGIEMPNHNKIKALILLRINITTPIWITFLSFYSSLSNCTCFWLHPYRASILDISFVTHLSDMHKHTKHGAQVRMPKAQIPKDKGGGGEKSSLSPKRLLMADENVQVTDENLGQNQRQLQHNNKSFNNNNSIHLSLLPG